MSRKSQQKFGNARFRVFGDCRSLTAANGVREGPTRTKDPSDENRDQARPGLRSRTARIPFRNAMPSFSIFAAVSAHAIVHTSPMIANISHAAAVAKCTCENIPNPPSLPVPLDSGPFPDCIHFHRTKAVDQGAKIKRELKRC
jgi:hypothetical protein